MDDIKERFKAFIKKRHITISEKSIDKMFNYSLNYDRENNKVAG